MNELERPLADPSGSQVQKAVPVRPLSFYGLSIAIAWVAWTPLLLHKYQVVAAGAAYPVLLFVCQTLGAFAPLLSLLLIQRLWNEPDLLKRIFSRLRFKGVPVLWIVLPAVLPVVMAVATAAVHGSMSPEANVVVLRPEPVDELGWALLFFIPFSFLLGLIGSPLGEEPGWRGYVFNGFVKNGRGLRGSGLVAVMWWIWHIPLFLVLDVSPDAYSFLELAGHSLLIDSLFLFSGRNLLVAMLYHQGVNTSFMFFAAQTKTIPGLILLIGTAICVRILAERHLRQDRADTEHV